MAKVGEKGHYLEWDRGVLEVRYWFFGDENELYVSYKKSI
jgi:hypothetical protein